MQIPGEIGANPFAVLSFIVAPAILTNASSVLAMSTSNRLARAVDRARELSRQLEAADESDEQKIDIRLQELAMAEKRALMLIQGLRSFYAALGGFASAALVSLLGSVAVTLGADRAVVLFEVVAVGSGLLAVGALIHGSVMLVRETRSVVQMISQRADVVRTRIASRRP